MPSRMGKIIAGTLALGVSAFVWSKRGATSESVPMPSGAIEVPAGWRAFFYDATRAGGGMYTRLAIDNGPNNPQGIAADGPATPIWISRDRQTAVFRWSPETTFDARMPIASGSLIIARRIPNPGTA